MRMYELNGAYVAEIGDEDFSNPWLLEEAFERLMERLKQRKLVVDLAQIESTMSLGVAVLVASQGLALIHRTKIAFAGVQPRLRRMLRLSGADQVLSLHGTVRGALQFLSRQCEVAAQA